jgi:hypothetical protein
MSQLKQYNIIQAWPSGNIMVMLCDWCDKETAMKALCHYREKYPYGREYPNGLGTYTGCFTLIYRIVDATTAKR